MDTTKKKITKKEKTETVEMVYKDPNILASLEGRTDFLIAEYSHYADSYLRNEEDGDRRATFFITAAGIVGGLVSAGFPGKAENPAATTGTTAATTAQPTTPAERPEVQRYLIGALITVLALGIVTFVRLVGRNVTTDKYLDGLARLRRVFIPHDLAVHLPENPYLPKEPLHWKGLLKGGWTVPVALVNGLLVFVLADSLSHVWWPISVGLAALTALALMLAGQHRRWQKNKERLVTRELVPKPRNAG